MKRIVLTAAASLVAVALAPQAASAAGFRYGVTAAEVSQSSAILWTRAPKTGKLTLDVARDKRFRRGLLHRSASAQASHDLTVGVKLRGLRSGTVYYYRFRQGKQRSARGQFVTAPSANSTKPFTFAYSGDADAQPAKGQSKPFWGTFKAYRSMAREANPFNINLGDTIYSDSEVGGTVKDGVAVPAFPLATTVQQKWAKYKMNLGQANLRNARAASGWFNQWDDHEFVNDFSIPTDGQALFNSGANAFADYMPVTRSASRGIYRTVRWGKNAELFFLDERSFRSAKVSAGHVCDNAQNHVPDLAPTAPQAQRDRFAPVYPPLAEPVPQACLDALRDPSRTMLGADQLARFTAAVKSSKARWKIVVNEVPIQQEYLFPYDRWEGYEADRQKVLTTLSSVKNTVVLATDEHATFYNDARFQTLEPGGPRNSGVTELVTGPVGTATEKLEYDAATGVNGTTDGVRATFYKPAPPEGLGMKCAVVNTFSYAQVEVSRTTLKLRPMDENGKALREPDQKGQPCGPFTLKAK